MSDAIRDLFDQIDEPVDATFTDRLLTRLLDELDAPTDEPEEPTMAIDLEDRPAPPATTARRPARWWPVAAAAAVAVAVVGAVLVTGGDDPSVDTAPAGSTTTVPFSTPAFSGDLAAGTYSTSRFAPEIRLTVGAGWHVRFERAGGFHLQQGDPDDSPAIVVISSTATRTVEDVVADYHDSASWTADAIVDSEFGTDGKQFDVVATGGGTPIGIDGQGALEVDPGDRLRIHVGRIGNATLLVAVVARPDRFDEFVTIADAVVISISE